MVETRLMQFGHAEKIVGVRKEDRMEGSQTTKYRGKPNKITIRETI